jgi:hypothetical protein
MYSMKRQWVKINHQTSFPKVVSETYKRYYMKHILVVEQKLTLVTEFFLSYFVKGVHQKHLIFC